MGKDLSFHIQVEDVSNPVKITFSEQETNSTEIVIEMLLDAYQERIMKTKERIKN